MDARIDVILLGGIAWLESAGQGAADRDRGAVRACTCKTPSFGRALHDEAS